MKTKKVAINYLYNLSYQLLAVILPVITMPYIARTLKADAIGAYSYTHSIAFYFSLFGIMGLNMYGQLQIAKNRDDKEKLAKTFWGVWGAKLITSVISIVAFCILILFSSQYKLLFLTYIVLLMANIFDISWLFQGIEEFKIIVIRNYIIKILSLILILVLIKTEKDLLLYSLIMQGSTFLGNASLWISINKRLCKVKREEVKVLIHLKGALPFFLPAIMSSIYTTMDKVMLGLIVESEYENGIYDQAHKIEQTASTVVSSLSTVLLPRMSYLFNNGQEKEYKKYLGNALGVVGLLSIPMMTGLCAISNTFVPIFLGSEFTECSNLLKIFSVLIFISGINTIIGNQCLVAQGKQKQYNIGVCVGAIVNVVLNYVMIPFIKSYGAAIASVIAEVIIFVAFVIFSKNSIRVRNLFSIWYRIIISAFLMGICVYLLQAKLRVSVLSLIIDIIIGIVVYCICLFLFREPQLKKIRIKH